MKKSRLQKERNKKSGELSHDSYDEGNCARTRPFSFDEIMLRRKNKHASDDVGVAMGLKTFQQENTTETVSDHSKSELGQRYGKNCSSSVDKNESDQYLKAQSRKKEEKTDVKKQSSSKESRQYDHESKEKLSKDLVGKICINKTNKEGHRRRDDIDTKPEERHRHLREPSPMDKHRERSRERFLHNVHEEKNREKHIKDRYEGKSIEKSGSDRYERSADKYGNDKHGERNIEKSRHDKYVERRSRQSSGNDRYEDRSRDISGNDRGGERNVLKSGIDRHEKRNTEKSGYVGHEERSRQKSGNDRYDERNIDKSGDYRHGERNMENSDRHGEMNMEKSDRHGEMNMEKSDRHGERNIEKSGNDRHGERNIEKSGNDRHGERNRQISGDDKYLERTIEKSGNDRHGERNMEKSGTGKCEERSRQKSGNDKREEKRRDKPSNDRHKERGKEKHDITEEQMRGKSGIEKNDKRDREKAGNDKYEERSRGRAGNEIYGEKTREIYEMENTRKHRLGDDEKYEDKCSTKKHDSGRILELKVKRESYKHYNEDSKLKRRRSRSREDNMEKNRGSLSPRVHKRSSFPEREHGESLNSLKDRPGGQHSDIDGNKTSNNGLKGHYHRHSGSARLGGYSPRKRKSDAAAKTPSPTNRMPDNKRDGRGIPSGGTNNMNFRSETSNFQSPNQNVSSSIRDPGGVVPVALNTMRSLFGAPSDGFSAKITASVDSVQLTEATRPQRRLYVENIPDSVTEKALMEFINNSMMSSCIYLIQGSQPCISCIINKQKGQALVEFLAPEYASAALCFDGSSLAGSILKVRRPKDFVEVATGELRKSVATVNRRNTMDPVDVQKSVEADDPQKTVAKIDTTSDFLNDLPHKIFICGISEGFSSDMVMEIAGAFGPVKSCYCESNAGQSYAILEYVNQSVTPKACAGLNGMKLGGQVLTVVEAVPTMSSLGTTGNSLLHEIPEHARPLLEQPTRVIKLKNVVTRESLTTLPESELELILEDVRIECARFGSIKSVNIVKYNNSNNAADSCETNGSNGFPVSGLKSGCDKNNAIDILEAATDQETREISRIAFENNPDGLTKDRSSQSDVVSSCNDVPIEQLGCRKMSIEDSVDFSNQINPSNESSHWQDDEKTPENPLHDEKIRIDYGECQDEMKEDAPLVHIDMEASQNLSKCHDKNSSKENSETHEKNADVDRIGDSVMDITAKDISITKGEDNENLSRAFARDDSKGKELDLTGEQDSQAALASDDIEGISNVKCESKEQDTDLNHIFVPGSIFVEYKRTEASCMAAHCLHGRSFDGRPVTVEYVPVDLYLARFEK